MQYLSRSPVIATNFIWPPEPIMSYLSPYHLPVPNFAKFCENLEILLQQANSTTWLAMPRSAKTVVPSNKDYYIVIITRIF